MSTWDHLKDFRLLRLNAVTNSVLPVEDEWYRRYGLEPVCLEAGTPTEILAHAAECDVLFVVSAALPRPVVEGLERCRLISRLGNGTDKIAVDVATECGIVVSNVPYFCVEEMSDHIMAMMLSMARQLPAMARHMVAGTYRDGRDKAVQLPRLSGQVLGIVGFGATGPEVARRARAFGLRVLATRKNRNAPRDEADSLGVEMVDLDTLLQRSDYVSLQLPLTSETYHLIDAAALAKMKEGAYLINTSRGALVDEIALAEVLRQGRLAGAGIDTFEDIDIFAENPQAPDHPLLELDNVVLTPHVSGLSAQAMEDVARTGVRNAVCVLSGHLPPPENIVNKGVVPRFDLAAYDDALTGDFQK